MNRSFKHNFDGGCWLVSANYYIHTRISSVLYTLYLIEYTIQCWQDDVSLTSSLYWNAIDPTAVSSHAVHIILTIEVLDLDERCVVGRFTVSGLINGDHSEFLFISLYQIRAQILKSLDWITSDLHPSRVVRCSRLDEVPQDSRASVGGRFRPRDLQRVARDVTDLCVTRRFRFSYEPEIRSSVIQNISSKYIHTASATFSNLFWTAQCFWLTFKFKFKTSQWRRVILMIQRLNKNIAFF